MGQAGGLRPLGLSPFELHVYVTRSCSDRSNERTSPLIMRPTS